MAVGENGPKSKGVPLDHVSTAGQEGLTTNGEKSPWTLPCRHRVALEDGRQSGSLPCLRPAELAWEVRSPYF